MDKTTQPQQLSFSFEDPTTRQTVVSLTQASAIAPKDSMADVKSSPALVYDFRSAVIKRKESTNAALYRQILDSVRHIG